MGVYFTTIAKKRSMYVAARSGLLTLRFFLSWPFFTINSRRKGVASNDKRKSEMVQ